MLAKEDSIQLHQILDQANKNYLKESRVNRQANFNILRVLSAFRMLFPDSPPTLYNAIIFITKNYNPQSLIQWKRAISDMSKQRTSISKPKSNLCKPETSKYMKTYQNSFNRDRINSSHFQSKSYAQIKIPAEVSLSHEMSFDQPTNKDISQTNAETGKRQYYTKADSITEQQKNHYISFQPYHVEKIYPHSYYEKENVNSTNIGESRKGESSYQYIEAIRRDLNKTDQQFTKETPFDQSFIKKIDSYESPYLLSQGMLDPQEEEMNERAFEFLKINLKFKAFTSLVANNLANQKAKQYRMKAETQNRANLLLKSFESLKENVGFAQMVRQKQKRADKHYSSKLQNNVINVLKLLFSLRIKPLPLDTTKLNQTAFEFILTLLLSIEGKEDSSATFMNLDSKISQLIDSHEIGKVYSIVKYFGKFSWVSEESVNKLIKEYKNSIMRKAFKVLLKEKEENIKYSLFRETYLKNQAYQTLKKRWNKIRQHKIKLMEAEGKSNKLLLAKVFKGFLEVIYSAKLYSKRKQYIQKKCQSHLKANFIHFWRQQTSVKIKLYQKLKQKCRLGVTPLTNFFKMCFVRKLREQENQIRSKEDKISNIIRQKRFAQFKNSFYFMRSQKNFDAEVQDKIKRLSYAIALSKWKENTKKGKALKSIITNIKHFYFRTQIAPFLIASIEKLKEIHQNQMLMKQAAMTSLKQWCQQESTKYIAKTSKLENRLLQCQKVYVFKQLLFNFRKEQEIKKRAETVQKNILLSDYLSKAQSLRCFKKMREVKMWARSKEENTEKLSIFLKISKFTSLCSKLRSSKQEKHREFILLEEVTRKRYQWVTQQIKRQIVVLKVNKITKKRKSIYLKKLGYQALRQLQLLMENEKFADLHYNQKVKQAAFIRLAEQVRINEALVADISQKKQNNIKVFCQQQLARLRKEVAIKKHSCELTKKMFFQQLINQNAFKNKEKEVNHIITNRILKQCITQWNQAATVAKKQKNHQQKSGILTNWLLISRLKSNYINSLMNKKYLYMAIKFKALKISQKVFQGWRQQHLRPSYRLKSQVENIRKANDRLSTDFI